MIQQEVFWNKFYKFLKDIKSDPDFEAKFAAKIANAENRNDYAKRIITIIDKIEEDQKIDYIINATRALCWDSISKSEYFRICRAITNCYIDDLDFVKQKFHPTNEFKADICTIELEANAMMYRANLGESEYPYVFTPLAELVYYAMSNNWVVENLENALETWNSKLSEIWRLLSESPTEFKGGGIWNVMVNINDALKAVGYALLVLFFLMGIMRQFNSFQEIKRPEQALKLFIRFVLAKAAVTWGLDLMMAMFTIVQGVISKIMAASGLSGNGATYLPQSMIQTIEDCGFWESIPLWAVTLIGSLLVWVLSFVMILTVYGRFFKLYIYAAIAPVPLSAFAGEETSHIGKAFIKSFAAVCLEGAVIVLGCIIYSLFAASPPSVAAGASAITQV